MSVFVTIIESKTRIELKRRGKKKVGLSERDGLNQRVKEKRYIKCKWSTGREIKERARDREREN